jgi:ABC-type phosphate/phosphonate transport system substrate-binding protein
MKSNLMMKLAFSFVLIGFFIVFSVNAQEMIYGKMGVLAHGISNTKSKDYRVAFKILVGEIGKKEHLIGEIKNYTQVKNIIDDFVVHKLDYIMINPYYIVKYHKKLKGHVAVYWSERKADSKYESMIVLVRKKSGINTLSDLKNKCVSIKDDNYMAKVVLDKALLASKIHHSYKNYIKNLSMVKTNSRAILQLYFGKTDAVIVPRYTYRFMQEMNPSIKKNLKIVYKTDAIFTPIVAMVNKQSSSAIIKGIQRGTESLSHTKNGKNILVLFKMKKVDIMNDVELEKLIAYYEKYRKLKRAYDGYK